MKVEVIAARELTPELVACWARFQEEDPELANPCFRPELIQSVAAVRDGVEIAVMRDGNEAVGFLPFLRGKSRIGGPHPFADYQGAIVQKGFQWNARDLVRGCGLAAWDFDRVLASQSAFRPYHRRLVPSAVMDLSKGYESYVAERRAAGSEQIKKAGNLLRRMEREVAPLRFTPHVNEEPILRQLIHWSDAKQGRGTDDSAVAEPSWVYRGVEKVLYQQTSVFRGLLSVLHAGEELVAAHFAMCCRDVLYSWWPAYSPKFEKYSPGIILMLKLAEAAASLGIRIIDLGVVAHWPYKQRLMNSTITVAEGSVEVPSLATAARRLRRAPGLLLDRMPALRTLVKKAVRTSPLDTRRTEASATSSPLG